MFGYANPTLKRGANKRCAYGAGRLVSAGMERSGTGPFEGPPTLKHPALPEDIYLAGVGAALESVRSDKTQERRAVDSLVPNSEAPGAPGN